MSGDGRKKVWYLRRIDLFASMTDAEIEELAALLDDHLIPAGVELLGARARDRVYILKTGAIRVAAGHGAEQVTVALLGPGRLLGLSPLFGDDSPAIAAVTLEPSYICFATWPKLLDVLAQYPQVLAQLIRSLAEQVFRVETWVERFRTVAPRERLASLLLELSAEFGELAAGGRRIRFRLTQADLARMIGASRESVSRALTEFARARWVVREEGLLVVRDHVALADLARDGPGV
jgi:CRP/FNR family transcriptional regulator